MVSSLYYTFDYSLIIKFDNMHVLIFRQMWLVKWPLVNYLYILRKTEIYLCFV